MRYLKPLLLNICFLGLGLTTIAANAMGAYQFHFQLPGYMNWVPNGTEQDSGGYTQIYVTEMPAQRIELNYGAGITTSLRNSMQEVLNNHTAMGAGCAINTYHVIQETGNNLTFSTTLDQCSNGKAMFEIIKTYNMPDGQYDILYSTNPQVTPPKMIQQMTRIVESTTVS